ncbi:hypothetical protein PN441_02590 [Spirulina major CS-329]|nr:MULTISPECIES: hypothetical protein [Spirulina]MDB9495398.1 hypothetical protein [Spirulina subsalsa CS-330]MDB9501943.1 hypothetical protein [Spirulina major CS-329]
MGLSGWFTLNVSKLVGRRSLLSDLTLGDRIYRVRHGTQTPRGDRCPVVV